MTDSEIKLCANEKMAIQILEFIKRGYEKNYQDGGVKKYTEALQMGIDALAETNRQKAEVDRLTEQLDGETTENMRLGHEIERLQNAYKQCAWERDALVDENSTEYKRIKALTRAIFDIELAEAKSEAINEFAERLKSKMFTEILVCSDCEAAEVIDSLVKEMDGASDA